MKKNAVKLSPEFKSQATKAILAIVLFMLLYLSILALSVALTILCTYIGITMILVAPGFLTIFLGFGIISLGALILIFLVKFLFKSHKVDRSHLTEIKKKDEPKLFVLIEEIVGEVGTDFPKKVYLSADVNACVFYDSSFLSMFLPIKKNLQIGLGLVNTVTEAELKAILAHEFGHFSQKTMKVGSYVYNVNQIIFNMLYDNESYDDLIQRWASISGFISIFVVLAVRIINGIQWLLAKMYTVVNKAYMALSREMEFHADEIAAHVTGAAPLQHSLLRISFAEHSFSEVLSFYEGKIADLQKSNNVYKEHAFVVNFLAKEHDLVLQNGLPKVTLDTLTQFNKSKLVIKDQWASHPSVEDRIARLDEFSDFPVSEAENPAKTLFKNIEETEKKITQKLFKSVPYQGVATTMSFMKFELEYRENYSSNTFSKIYNRYYDNNNPRPFDLEVIIKDENFVVPNKLDLFSEEKVDLVYTLVALKNDIETLAQMTQNHIQNKTFDYDGKKYERKFSKKLSKELEAEGERVNEKIKENDKAIFAFFYAKAKEKGAEAKLIQLYQEFFDFDTKFDERYKVSALLSDGLQFIGVAESLDEIKRGFRKAEPLEENLKVEINHLLQSERCQAAMTDEIKKNLELYTAQKWRYYTQTSYVEQNLEILSQALNNYVFVLSKSYFLFKKELLDFQESLWD